MTIKSLSLVIPAYKQEKTIVKDIEGIEKVLKKLSYNYEIIVVVDGCSKTYKSALKIKSSKVKVFTYENNQGKGYAVKYGVAKTKGDVVGFLDAGSDIDPSEISIALDLMDWNNADIIVGSKLHPESKVKYPITRKILSWGYRSLTRLLFGFNIRDTQVGFKIYKKKVAKDIFPKLLVKKFAFDIEILAVAYSMSYTKIYEAPVKLEFKGASSITSYNFWKVIFWMLWDTFAVFYRLKILKYYNK